MNLELKGKNAIVTGASRGLGRAIALRLAAEGANVVINYQSSEEKAQETAGFIQNTCGVRALPIRADVADETDVARLFKQTEDALGPVDILINNAGINPISLVCDMDLSEWEAILKVNLTGTFLPSREMVRRLMRAGRKGCIVNIASQVVYNGSKNGKSHYAASKGGVVAFTISLAKEVEHLGIRVNAVVPGLMFTDMTENVLDTPEKIEQYNRKIPIGRIADVDEVARAAVFLASSASSLLNGSLLDVSGGLTER
jgi:3-oxoacyl-[acyl-carrier protein] reductase